jgi:hypothetical protein
LLVLPLSFPPFATCVLIVARVLPRIAGIGELQSRRVNALRLLVDLRPLART